MSWIKARSNGALFSQKCTKALVHIGYLIHTLPIPRTYRSKAWVQIYWTTTYALDTNKFQTSRSIVSWIYARCNRALFKHKNTKVLVDNGHLIHTLPIPRTYGAKTWIELYWTTTLPLDTSKFQTGRFIVSRIYARCNGALFNKKCTKVLVDNGHLIHTLPIPELIATKRGFIFIAPLPAL